MKPIPELLILPPRTIIEDEPVTDSYAQQVHVVSIEPTEPSQEQLMRIVEVSGCLDFWQDPEEDIYSPEDGTTL